MDPLLLAGILSGITSFISGILNYRSQTETNLANLDYAKATTQEQWERDDSTYQRSVADATAAGFSPLAVLDGGLVNNSSAIGYQGQAPQFDLNGILNAMMSTGDKLSQYNENNRERQFTMYQTQQNFSHDIDMLYTSSELSNEQKDMDFLRSLELMEDTLYYNHETEKYNQTVREGEQLGAITYQPLNDFTKVQKANKETADAFHDEFEQFKSTQKTTGKTQQDKETVKAAIPGANGGMEYSDTDTNTIQETSLTAEQWAQNWWKDKIWYYYEPDYTSKSYKTNRGN